MRHYPSHRRLRLLVRRCVCGLRWPCPDNTSRPDGAPIPDGEPDARLYRAGLTDPTAAFNTVGRAGQMTPTQAHRAGMGGGR
jgi:hypothetical protein